MRDRQTCAPRAARQDVGAAARRRLDGELGRVAGRASAAGAPGLRVPSHEGAHLARVCRRDAGGGRPVRSLHVHGPPDEREPLRRDVRGHDGASGWRAALRGGGVGRLRRAVCARPVQPAAPRRVQAACRAAAIRGGHRELLQGGGRLLEQPAQPEAARRRRLRHRHQRERLPHRAVPGALRQVHAGAGPERVRRGATAGGVLPEDAERAPRQQPGRQEAAAADAPRVARHAPSPEEAASGAALRRRLG
eukprot:scaffold88527_cov75-Phaeocystis_antarctica.AAC.1